MTTETSIQPNLTAALNALLDRSGTQPLPSAEQIVNTVLANIELWTLTHLWKTDHDSDEDHGGVFTDKREAMKAAADTLAERLSTVDQDSEEHETAEILALIEQGEYGQALGVFARSDVHSLIDWTYRIEKTVLNKAV